MTHTRTARRLLAGIVFLAVPLAPLEAQLPDTAFFQGMAARSIGPAGMSGRVGAIDAVASDPNVIWVGGASGGVWKSTDLGVTWTALFDRQPVSSVGAIAINQAHPDVVWVGTGEATPRNSVGVGRGVYRTIDGGRTWSLLGLEKSEKISEIELDPRNQDVAFVAALGPTWSDGTERGVFRTRDGGRTWQRVLYVNESTGAADLVMDPQNPNKLIAAMWEHRRWPWFFNSGGPGSGLYITYDGGDSWRKLGPENGLPKGHLGRIGLAIAQNDPRVVYALVEAEKSVLLRSDDGGESWRVVNDTRGISNRPFYYSRIRVDPGNENRIYSLYSSLAMSEDGGKTFRRIDDDVHPDHHALWIEPTKGELLIDGNDGGVYISTNRGRTWRFVENLPFAQFYHIAVDDARPFNIYGGMQDNGSWRGPSAVWENGGIRNYHWQEVGFGDGFATVPDPTDARYGYAMSQGGNLIRFDLVTGERKSIRPAHPQGVELRFNWNAAIHVDPRDGTIYYGSQFVHRSRDRGHSWEIISPDLTTNDPEKQKQEESGGLSLDVTAAENHTTILSIAPSPLDRNVIWAGTDDGNVQVTRDGGATWTSVGRNIRGVPAATWVPHMEASKFDAGTAFVVFDDHRRGNWTTYVYRTTDYGRSWTSLATPEIDGFVHVIEQDPVVPDLLYLGTEFGLFVSTNGGRRWSKWTAGVPTTPVVALHVHPRDHDLVVATHGRGAFILDDVRPLRAVATQPQARTAALTLFDVPDAYLYTVKQVDGYHFPAQAMFAGENRPYGALITYALAQGSDSAKASIEILDEKQAVVRRLDGPAKSGVNRVAWNLRADGPRRDDDAESGGGRFGNQGAYVPPGSYTVRVKANGQTATAPVRVVADPRINIAVADREAKRAAIERVRTLQETSSEAQRKLRASGQAVDAILTQLRGKQDATSRALRAQGDSLKQKLDAATVRFTGRRDVQGLARSSSTVQSRIGAVSSSLPSSQDAPTESQLIYLRQAEEALASALAEVNRLLGEDVAAFKRAVEAAGVSVFPSLEPVRVEGQRE